MIGIHGELTADGTRLVLIAAGQVEAIAYAAKLLGTATPLFTPSDPPGALVCPASWPAVVQLQALYGTAFVAGPRLDAWIGEQLAARDTRTGAELTAPVPDGLTARPYQVDGALVIAATGRALVFDEPRTGKTITTILGLRELAMRQPITPVIVVAPASVVDPWVSHFQTWAPELTTVAWRGAPARRKRLPGTADVYVVSYDTAVRDAANTKGPHAGLVQLTAKSVITDECHFLKNPDAARTHAVTRIAKHATAFVALSGTPITHHADGLLPTLRILAPGAYPNRERWVARYMLTNPTADYGQEMIGLNPHTEREFRLSLLGQHRRVARADVMSQLPPKVYSVRTVELPAEYRKAYDSMESDMLAQLPDGQELSVMDVLSQLNALSRLSCAAADVEVTYGPDEDQYTGEPKRHQHINLKLPSWKIDALLELLEERRGERTVAFCVSAQLARLAGPAAAKQGHRVGYIIGGQTQRERTDTIAAFQRGQLDLVCATTGAGGVGITLSSAGTLAFLQRPYSLVESLQAEDRAEGDLTQVNGTEIVDIIAANTVDTRIRAVLREKAGALSDLVQDPRVVAQLLGGASVTRLRKAVA